MFTGDNFLNFSIELYNVDFLSGILGFHIGGNGEVIIITLDFLITCQMREMLLFLAFGKGGNNVFNVFLRQLIVVRDFDALTGASINSVLLSALPLFSTMMQVAMDVPKNRLLGI